MSRNTGQNDTRSSKMLARRIRPATATPMTTITTATIVQPHHAQMLRIFGQHITGRRRCLGVLVPRIETVGSAFVAGCVGHLRIGAAQDHQQLRRRIRRRIGRDDGFAGELAGQCGGLPVEPGHIEDGRRG